MEENSKSIHDEIIEVDPNYFKIRGCEKFVYCHIDSKNTIYKNNFTNNNTITTHKKCCSIGIKDIDVNIILNVKNGAHYKIYRKYSSNNKFKLLNHQYKIISLFGIFKLHNKYYRKWKIK